MRVVIQRVLSASVTVEGEVVSSIDRGYLLLVGVERGDQEEDAKHIAKQVLKARLFPDDDGKDWKKNVVDLGLDILCVSQFTLYGALNKGTKPDFHHAMPPTTATSFYAQFVESMRKAYAADKVHDGIFGAYMKVALQNDGPITLIIDSADKRKPKGATSTS